MNLVIRYEIDKLMSDFQLDSNRINELIYFLDAKQHIGAIRNYVVSRTVLSNKVNLYVDVELDNSNALNLVYDIT